MIIEAHLLCYNEMPIIEKVIRHYYRFCDDIIIYDNHSTDGSAELARSWNCEVIPFGDKFFNDENNMRLKNECWQGSDADWAIVGDMDELLWMAANSDEAIKTYLRSAMEAGHTILPTTGWQIMSEEMPTETGLLTDISSGYFFKNYSKSVIFNPKKITAINYGPGAHECRPEGEVKSPEQSPLFVLHYKHIGGVERTINRYREYMKRMSKTNLKNGWGCHYKQNERQLRREWKERMEKSKPLF